MKVLVLGADGMLGHQLVQAWRGRHDVVGTVRRPIGDYAAILPWLPEHTIDRVDARDPRALLTVIRGCRPDAVVNAVGIVKQRPEASSSIESIETNSLLPHYLAQACGDIGARLVHLSTDCVFSGRRGHYSEDDLPDATDLYGRSKLLGEVSGAGSLTLRSSIIGLELSRKKSLVEWFLSQAGPVNGYRRAIYTGLTTLEMARVIERVLQSSLCGLYHVASAPIDKYSLLCRFDALLGRNTPIVPDDGFSCDRSLDGTRFETETGYQPPSWDAMLSELAQQTKERYG